MLMFWQDLKSQRQTPFHIQVQKHISQKYSTDLSLLALLASIFAVPLAISIL